MTAKTPTIYEVLQVLSLPLLNRQNIKTLESKFRKTKLE